TAASADGEEFTRQSLRSGNFGSRLWNHRTAPTFRYSVRIESNMFRIHAALSPPSSGDPVSATITGLWNRRSSRYLARFTWSKLCHRKGLRMGPGLNPLTPTQSTYEDPGQSRSMRFLATWGTERWFTLHTHVAFVAPTCWKMSCMRRHAATYSVGVFPRENADH